MHPRTLLRLEGLVVFLACTAGFFWLEGPLWLFLLLALAPDVAMVAYLAGPTIGSFGYNVLHTYALPLTIGALGLVQETTLLVLVALVWAAHIGADRAITYGLKYPTEFQDTHLDRL